MGTRLQNQAPLNTVEGCSRQDAIGSRTRKLHRRLGHRLGALCLGVATLLALATAPVFGEDVPDDYRVFMAGFEAYKHQHYVVSQQKLHEVLNAYPDTPLRDVTMFWLSRAYYRSGNQMEAARYLSQFAREYPENPLNELVESELVSLVARFEKGERLSGQPQPPGAVARKGIIRSGA